MNSVNPENIQPSIPNGYKQINDANGWYIIPVDQTPGQPATSGTSGQPATSGTSGQPATSGTTTTNE